MDLTPDQVDILFDASEDYTGLWDAKWECSRQKSDLPENELVTRGQEAIKGLLQLGLISLYRQSVGMDFTEVTLAEANFLLRELQHWQLPPHENSVSIYFAATDAGLRVLREDEQVRAYYKSSEFLERYPAPEWHPMKRS